jgi:hypothetical protein
MYLAPLHLDIHVIQSFHPVELFGDMVHLQDMFRHLINSFTFLRHTEEGGGFSAAACQYSHAVILSATVPAVLLYNNRRQQ